MHRRALIVLTLAAVGALGLTALSPAHAVTAEPYRASDMVGSLDFFGFVPGSGLVLSGWALDLNHPSKQNVTGKLELSRGAQASEIRILDFSGARPDVAAAVVGAGPNHGFSTSGGYYEPGAYRGCLKVKSTSDYQFVDTDQYGYVTLGCKDVVIPVERMSGALESLSIDNSRNMAGLWVKGWAANNWAYPESNSVRLVIEVTDAEGRPVTSYRTPTLASERRVDIESARPGTPGIRGFYQHIDAPVGGTYRVCGTASPWLGYSGAVAADLGCLSGTFDQLSAPEPPEVLGVPTVGTTLDVSTPRWSHPPVSDSLAWTDPSGIRGPSTAPGQPSRSRLVTVADVGRSIDAYYTVLADGVLGVSGFLGAGTATIAGVTSDRLSGADRYDASIEISRAAFPDDAEGAPVVYIASGANFPDALSAGPAAAAEGGPLLLTVPTTLRDDIRAEVSRLQPAKIVVVGGPASVSDTVVAELSGIAPTQRISGADRYEVSRAVARYAFSSGTGAVYLATGAGFADAIPAAAAASSRTVPLLLVNGQAAAADGATVRTLADLGVRTARIVGGPASVSAGIASTLGSGITVSRATGADRYAAAIEVNRSTFATADTVYLTTGLNYPDGLSAGPLGGRTDAPIYLSDGTCIRQEVLREIIRLGADRAVILGGASSMSPVLDILYACAN